MPSPNDNHVRAALGRRIRQLRKAKGLTQTELGDRSGGIKTGEISRFETAQRTPSIETLARLATGLNVSLPELLDFEDPGQPLPEAEQITLLLRDQPEETRHVAVSIIRALVGAA
ncbi:MAG: helix-turn-helix transcriptional regulator [Alphaproteobacteria bacterium]|nr:helix-turn-helix transcriptional regulator [Alphaproteobacteria bacterium]MCB9794745.1 helix-turn-helix transcriptional regulator [Alphaproteobacteria bacterium]